MIIKKFQAENETDAILMAKEELGKDAIVMNIKTIKPKGIYKFVKRTLVEVTAAIDDMSSYEQSESIISEEKESQSMANISKAQAYAYSKDIIFEDDEVLDEKPITSAIEEKLNSLQDLLEQQVQSKTIATESKIEEDVKLQPDKNQTYISLIKQKLIDNEVEEKYVDQIIQEIGKNINKDSVVDNILATIYQKIVLKLGQVKGIDLVHGKTKFVFFIGSTGVGKTTTIAKIASHYKLNKKLKVALITSDTYRIAAVEQLRTYANILGIPLKVVYSSEELKDIKNQFEQYDLVLVDTAGRSHRNREQREDIRQLIDTIPVEDREVYLVLSATTKYSDLVKIAEVYKGVIQYKLIFTKLDETSGIGVVLNIKMLTDSTLSYVTWGQNVPDDIGKIDAQKIAKQLLGGNDLWTRQKD